MNIPERGSTELKFFMGKKDIPKEAAKKAPILASGSMLGLVDSVFAFEDESSFLSWAERMPVGEKFLRLNRMVEAARQLENSELTEIKNARRRRTESLMREIEDLAARYKLPVNSRELFMKATSVDCHPLEGPVFDPAIIYEHINYGGSWRPLAATIPDFRWIGFNDKASSLRVSGAGILFEHTWYRGRRFYFGGIPVMDFPDLRLFTFNDLASSVALL